MMCGVGVAVVGVFFGVRGVCRVVIGGSAFGRGIVRLG